MQYFGLNIVEGVADSWVEAEMSWVEVDGAGWRWVHGLVIPYIKLYSYSWMQNIRLFLQTKEVSWFFDMLFLG